MRWKRSTYLAIGGIVFLAAVVITWCILRTDSSDASLGERWRDLRAARTFGEAMDAMTGETARNRQLELVSLWGIQERLLPDDPFFVLQGAKKGSDAPMFGGTPQRNMVNLVDKNIPVTWSVKEGKQKNIKWSVDLGTKAYGGPVIAEGKIFVGTNADGKDAILMAFNESDGKFLWKITHEYPDTKIFDEAKGSGLCSTPVVENGRVYYVTPACEVVCADTDGKIKWKVDMMKELKVIPHHLANCSPLIAGDLLMVVTGNGVDEHGTKVPSPKAPSFVAFEKSTGKVKWQSNLPGDKIVEGTWSNPVLATVNGKQQVIFPGGDITLYSFEPETGNLIWKCNLNPSPKPPGSREIDNYILATPVVVDDRLYLALGPYPEHPMSTRSSYIVCVDITKKGDVSIKSFDAKAPANKDSALVWAFGGPIDPEPEKGRKYYFGSSICTACVHDGLVYIPEERGYLHCLDAKTGKRYWEHDFKTGVWSSAYYVDGKIYMTTEEGTVYIFEHGKNRKWYIDGKLHTPDGSKQDAKGSVDIEGGVHSTPVVANGVLYLTTHSKLYAIHNGK